MVEGWLRRELPPAAPTETQVLLAHVDDPAAISRPGATKSLLPTHGPRVHGGVGHIDPPSTTSWPATASSRPRGGLVDKFLIDRLGRSCALRNITRDGHPADQWRAPFAVLDLVGTLATPTKIISFWK